MTKQKKGRIGKTNETCNIMPRKETFTILCVYVVFAVLWFFLLEYLFHAIVSDLQKVENIILIKNLIYLITILIPICMMVIYRAKAFRKMAEELNEKNERMQFTYDELQAAYEQLVATESELSDQKNLNDNIFMDANVMISIWNSKGKVLRMNPYSLELLGYTEQETAGKSCFDLLLSDEAKNERNTDGEKLSVEEYFNKKELRFETKNGRIIDIAWSCKTVSYQNRPSEILSIGTDITEYKRLEKRLRNLAYYDSLTGLPNRSYMEHLIRKSLRENVSFAIAHFDVDNFKQINDTLGFEMGDMFLTYISNKLNNLVEEPDFVSRTSGDEFLILINLPELSVSSKTDKMKEKVEAVVKDLIRKVGKSWEMDSHEFFISFSVGVSIYPEDGKDAHTLLKNADVAMYKAKRDRKGSILFYTKKILDENVERLHLSNQLKYAMKNGELMLYYQPQYNLMSGQVVGLEVLVRWKHPTKGFIPPGKFIPIAEETGQIYELDKWIFRAALNQKKKFEETGRENLEVSINLSSKTLASKSGLRELEKELQETDVDFSHITIEITETAIISDLGLAIERLKRLRELGMKIALDDFGTGFSSLTYLKDLPIDLVKLDQSFVKSIEKGGKEALIIKDVLNLANNLKYEVIAEGIETQEQWEYLKEYHCKIGQGYLMSRPVPIEKIEKFFLENEESKKD